MNQTEKKKKERRKKKRHGSRAAEKRAYTWSREAQKQNTKTN